MRKADNAVDNVDDELLMLGYDRCEKASVDNNLRILTVNVGRSTIKAVLKCSLVWPGMAE